ncbi:unnamed protein product [Microthlaspi erraticum]|uniref:FBD domain-containing protein n=1 Tax=Microthlaspi erraticum TaxID=1685480 RepID=A0A6D2LC58_9BRAS|nr:unnamed protein product [Microthlaspi erraticum]
MDVLPGMACLPSLKDLQLGLDGESLGRLLSVCPLLENLLVDFCSRYARPYTVGKIIVRFPSLQSLALSMANEFEVDRLEIDAPALKVLSDQSNLSSVSQYVQRLRNCLERSSTLLSRLLTDSPNLRVLNIFQMTGHYDNDMVLWDRPSHVPACFESSLKTFIWSEYLGRQQDRKIAVYILRRASLLKTARFSSDDNRIPKLKMLKDLSESRRASRKCKLFFY